MISYSQKCLFLEKFLETGNLVKKVLKKLLTFWKDTKAHNLNCTITALGDILWWQSTWKCLHIIYHCPFTKVIISYFMTTIRIFTGINLKVSIGMIITNTIPRGIRNRLGRKVGKKAIRLIIILLAIAKKYIYNAYYKLEANVSNSEIYFAFQNFLDY